MTTQEDPMLSVWRGGSLLASSPDFETLLQKRSIRSYGHVGVARDSFTSRM
ncbi:Actin-related protein 6 [Orobanche hederae]